MNAKQRVDVYRSFFDHASSRGQSPLDLLRPDFKHARFKLGTSLADYSLPYILHPQLRKALADAQIEFLSLFLKRNQDKLGCEDGFILPMKYDLIPKLGPLSYSAPPSIENPYMRQTLESSYQYLFLFDCGISASWIRQQSRGRELLGRWSGALLTAVDEMTKTGGTEETPYFLTWIMLKEFFGADQIVHKLPLRPNAKKVLTAATLTGLYIMHTIVKEMVMSKKGSLLKPDSRIGICWSALLNPRVAFMFNFHCYNVCSFYDTSASILGDRGAKLLNRLGREISFAGMEEDVKAVLSGEKGLRSEAMNVFGIAFFRRAMLDVLATGIPARSELFGLLQKGISMPGVIENILTDKLARKNTVKMLGNYAAKYRDGKSAAAVSTLADLFKGYVPKNPLKGLSRSKEAVLDDIRENIIADLCDTYIAAAAKELMGSFRLRSGMESDRDLAALYSEGRLYQVGASPILEKKAAPSRVAHYFIDLKDYTQRTTLLKEDVMADFLREHFFAPILEIAREHHRGMPQLADRGGTHLNNLLGDAVSISGNIVAVVDVIIRIRQHLENYSDMLEKRHRDAFLTVRAKDIRMEYGQRIEAVSSRRQSLLASKSKYDSTQLPQLRSLEEKVQDLMGQEMALKRDMEEELARLSGQHLISGSFTSYGAVANVVTFDDPVWGNIDVSISEKINESARGTSRIETVLKAVNRLLDIERERLKNPNLELPFRIYLCNTMGLPLSPDIELALQKAFLSEDDKAAYKLYMHAAQAHIKKTMSYGNSGIKHYLQEGMAIYNAGDALSGEALAAYRKDGPPELQFVNIKIPIESLDRNIRNRYAFFEPALRLVAGLDSSRRVKQLFRFAGSMTFKGFEAALPAEIWEIVNVNTGIGKLLAESPEFSRVIEGHIR